MKKDPFYLGAKVAVESSRGDGKPYVAMWVAGVRKNGNFVLAEKEGGRPDPQQYRPYGDAGHSTGGGFGGDIVRPWTADIEKENVARTAAWRHKRRCQMIRELFGDPTAVSPEDSDKAFTLLRGPLQALSDRKKDG